MHRHELFNALLKGNSNAKYLEIGVDNPESTFLHVEAKSKYAVDPYSDDSNKCHAWNANTRQSYINAIVESGAKFHQTTSDEFFDNLGKRNKFDLIFIDGLHTEEQVQKDVENSLKFLKQGGYIILDDALPNNELEAVEVPKAGQPWRGTVYKYIAKERMNKESNLRIICNDHMNLAVIQKGKPEIEAFSRDEFPNPTMSYEFYYTFKKDLMNVLPFNEFLEKLGVSND